MIPFPYADENPGPGRREFLILLIIANVLAIGLWDRESIMKYGFFAFQPRVHQWISSQFLHSGFEHLLGNMWFLWIFGDNVEGRLGGWFLPFYLASGVAANFVHQQMNPAMAIPAIGASGAICGVIGAYLVLFPRARIKCVSMGRVAYRFGLVRYSMSAFLFGLLYLAWQFVEPALSKATGVAHGAHIGGLLFGMAVGAALRLFGEEEAPALSGPSGSAPATGTPEAQAIVDALANGNEEFAAQQYIRLVRADPYLELPEEPQLQLAGCLAEFGYPHLAKHAAERFLLRRRKSPLAPRAEFLLGELGRRSFLDPEAAIARYEAVAASPAAPDELKAEASARLAECRKLLGRTFTDTPERGDAFWIVREGSGPLSAAKLAAAARILNERPDGLAARLSVSPGFLAQDAPAEKAAALADLLEAAGVPVLVVPRRRLVPLPSARLCERVACDLAGIAVGEGQRIAWKDCLLIAAAGIYVSALKPAEMGLFGVDVEGMGGELVETPEAVPILEVFAASPLRRLRFLPCDHLPPSAEELAGFYDAAQELVVSSHDVPIDPGIDGIFDRAMPEPLLFRDAARLDAYMGWQLQLAFQRKTGAYGAMGGPRTDPSLR